MDTDGSPRRLPNLLVAGVKKAGTTSLAAYLGRHPEICPGDVKTVNAFRSAGPVSERLEEYARHWAHANGQRYRLEAPSSYFYGGRTMAEQVDRVLPGARVIVSLRDPVTRLWSDFHMKRREEPHRFAHLDIEEFVRRAEAAAADGDLEAHPGYTAFARGRYVDVAPAWLDLFGERLRIVFLEQWAARPAETLQDLLAWLDLDPEPLADAPLSAENPQRDFRSRRAARGARLAYRAATRAMPPVRHVKASLVAVHARVNHANGEAARQRMPAAVEAHLREVYAPANDALASLLAAHGYRDLPPWLGGTS